MSGETKRFGRQPVGYTPPSVQLSEYVAAMITWLPVYFKLASGLKGEAGYRLWLEKA